MKSVAASAPARCGIIGNPSDIYGGVLVSSSVPARAFCRLTRGQAKAPDDSTLWDAVLARYPVDEVAVEWSSRIPRSSGLAGSTALLAATLLCVRTLLGKAPDLSEAKGKYEFAEEVRDIEYHEAGVVCGYQDAYMAVFGGVNRLDFASKHPAVQGGLPGELTPIEVEDLPFVLVNTGSQRMSGQVHSPVRERWLAGELKVVEAMNRLGELGSAGSLALAENRWEDLARAMNENHQIAKELDLSGEVVDDLVETCRKNGALGAKLAGAGHGGTVIALVEDKDEFLRHMGSAGFAETLEPKVEPGVSLENESFT
jgi:galactokinase/mevalonate kinase-like predicted kinase